MEDFTERLARLEDIRREAADELLLRCPMTCLAGQRLRKLYEEAASALLGNATIQSPLEPANYSAPKGAEGEKP